MGKVVNLGRPITDEERMYLMDRAREYQVAANDREFGHLSEEQKETLREEADENYAADREHRKAIEAEIAQDEEDGFDEDLYDTVIQYDTNILKKKLASAGKSTEGKKDVLMRRLLQHMQDERDAADVAP